MSKSKDDIKTGKAKDPLESKNSDKEKDLGIIENYASGEDSFCTSDEKEDDIKIPIYKPKPYKKILVLSGGGVKGISHVGTLRGLEEKGYLKKFKILAGSSVGALVISMYLVGYTPDELYKFISKFEIHRVKSLNIFNFLKVFGLDNGSRVIYVLKRLIQAKTNKPLMTLKDLYNLSGKKLILTTVCLNTMETCYLSHETHPNLPLYLAIRMSISIPWFFTPVSYNNRLYVDGGVKGNYPIQLFKDSLDDVIGVYIVESHNTSDNIDNIEEFSLRTIECFMEGAAYNSKRGYEKCTININLGNINSLDFSLDLNKKEEMYKKGYEDTV